MIPIKSFIVSLCAVIIVVITGFFYLEANRVLGRRFEEIDAIHSKSVVEYARTVLEGRRYLLTAFRSQIDPDNHLAKSFIVASGKKDFTHVKKAIEVIRKRTKCDVVDIIDISDGSSVGIPDLKHALSGRRIVHNGESIIIVTQIQGHLAILSLSPLMLFQYPVGVAALGYYLDGELTREISNATNTRVSFASPDLADTHGTRIKIGDGGGEVSLVANSHVMTSITHELRGDVLTIAASSLVLVILLIYSILNFGFLRSFREILSSIEGSAEDLAKNKITERRAKRYPIREVAILSSVFARFTKSLFDFQRRIQQKSQAEAAGKVLSLVVHDTNKAVGAMFMELDLDKEEISEHKRRSIHNLATRIQGISGSVLAKFEKDSLEAGGEVSVENFVLPTEPPSVEMLSLLVDSIAAEKSMFHWNKSQAQIEVEIDPESFKVFVEVQPEAFNRALGSIVDNAVQSISGPGRVTLSIHADEEHACIRVTDTGCGIAKEKFSELGEWGNSFGKPEGVGVGFWYVKQIVAFWKGDLDIKSDPGRGTSIEMQLPRSKRESVLLSELSIEEGSLLITLDDEDSMTAQWEARLNGLEISDRVERRHFHKAHELLVWWRTQGRDLGKTPLFLCDYQLGSQDWNGLQVIEEMGIGANSILVTGYFDKKEVREGCSHLGIRLLPKTIVPFLPILIKHRGKKVGGVTAGGAA